MYLICYLFTQMDKSPVSLCNIFGAKFAKICLLNSIKIALMCYMFTQMDKSRTAPNMII